MSKEIILPPHDQCTGCGVCEMICPKGCIQFEKDAMDCRYPVIDKASCVQCGSCMRHCHALKNVVNVQPQIAYAAWNTNEAERKTSASGGIATAIYTYALQRGIATYGVKYTPHQGAEYMPIHTAADIAVCKNSKYVSSECKGVFPDIKQHLIKGESVIFIGLPCHVSALRSYLGKEHEQLILVDVICHGVAPNDYLEQHLQAVESKKKKKADTLYFRDPQYGTENFYLSLVKGRNRFYHALPRGNDSYNTGYHTALTYRENCYHCRYATSERVTDITIGDFSGLGKFALWTQTKVGVSCILVNTEKGRKLLETLTEKGMLHCEERPLAEALKVEKQLMHPSVPHPNRDAFRSAYEQSHDFEKAVKGLLWEDISNAWKAAMKKKILGFASGLVPKSVKKAGRSLIQKVK